MASNREFWRLDVRNLTPAGFVAALLCCAVGLMAMFLVAFALPLDSGLRARAGGWLMVGALFSGWFVSMCVTFAFFRIAGISFSKQELRRAQALQSFSQKTR